MNSNEANKCGIYLIKNTQNGKVYIGSSKNISERWKSHVRDLSNNCHHSIKLQRSWNQTKSKTNFIFEIIELVDDESTLFEREQYYIDQFDAYKNGYNCSNVAGYPGYDNQGSQCLRSLYDEFEYLYLSGNFRISDYFLDRIRNRQYKKCNMCKILDCMRWFVSKYTNLTFMGKLTGESKSIGILVYDSSSKLIDSFPMQQNKIIPLDPFMVNLMTKEVWPLIHVDQDGIVTWIDDEYPDSKNAFSYAKRMCKTKTVKLINSQLIIMEE